MEKPFNTQDVIDDLEDNPTMPYHEIARRNGCCTATVCEIRQKYMPDDRRQTHATHEKRIPIDYFAIIQLQAIVRTKELLIKKGIYLSLQMIRDLEGMKGEGDGQRRNEK